MSSVSQDVLLSHLGVTPKGSDPWPMTVRPRSLAVLAEILLLRQQCERESSTGVKTRTENLIINIWSRFMDRLQSAITDFDNSSQDVEGRDMKC